MKPRIAVVAIALFSGGCAARDPSVETSGILGPASISPTDDEARNAYNEFRYRLACPDVADCDDVLWRQQPRISQVSQVECVPATRRSRIRCTFVVHERVPFGAHLHQCAGMFRRLDRQWSLLSVIGPCFGLPVRLES
ncbi:MAG TPA: hypothetical protein VD887_08305 [Allosphingosinicella sp.]|nr:hypothetical protein [Allosphingosinicella sp.]